MLFLWCVLIHTVKKRWLSLCDRNLHNCIRISILVPLRIDIFATGKHVNHGVEYGLLNTIFHFYGPKKPLNSPKIKIIKIEETLSKVKFIQISYKKSLIWPDIGRARYRGVSSGE